MVYYFLYKTSIIETGFSAHHNMILSFFRTHFERLKSKKLEYRNYNKFDRSVIDKHTSLKTKIIRGNQAPFMMKALSKAIMTRSRLRSRYNKWPSRENNQEKKT